MKFKTASTLFEAQQRVRGDLFVVNMLHMANGKAVCIAGFPVDMDLCRSRKIVQQPWVVWDDIGVGNYKGLEVGKL